MHRVTASPLDEQYIKLPLMSDDVRGSCGYNDSFCEGGFDEIV